MSHTTAAAIGSPHERKVPLALGTITAAILLGVSAGTSLLPVFVLLLAAALAWAALIDDRGIGLGLAAGAYAASTAVQAQIAGVFAGTSGRLVIFGLTVCIVIISAGQMARFGVRPQRYRAALLLLTVGSMLLLHSSPHDYSWYGRDKGSITIALVLIPATAILLGSRLSLPAFCTSLVVAAAPLVVWTLFGWLPLTSLELQVETFAHGNSVWYGRTLALGFIGAVTIAVKRKSPALVGVALVIGLALLASNKEGPIIASLLALAVIASGASTSLNWTRVGGAFLVSVPLVLILAAESRAVFGTLDWDGNLSTRLALYSTAIDGFLASPVLGNGWGSYRAVDRFVPTYYPHNIVLEVAAETGLIGITLLIVVTTQILRNARPDFFPLLALSIVFAAASGGVPENVEWPVIAAAAIASTHDPLHGRLARQRFQRPPLTP